ncbi:MULTISPECIES: phosphoribosylglycinamide formyltransferase [unclassified Lebetimonas]|uniref:phosphoribosylglycinamide formyltransferase n=1 Tax=unclassified Lebetimonas TaxID=2648158 RepID=UPI000463E0E9|nr:MULTISPECIES: formyltransferase family protein [unclassified Lebetimonas]
MKRVVVFFGKGGSNFLNLIKKENNYKIIAGITNRADSDALKEKNLPPILISSDFNEILEHLKNLNPDLIVLAGFMKIVPSFIINEFKGKIINLHPSILPNFKGLNADKLSFEAKKACGITVHFASEELDSGDIILQYHINPYKFKTYEEYHKELKKAEWTFLPDVVERINL